MKAISLLDWYRIYHRQVLILRQEGHTPTRAREIAHRVTNTAIRQRENDL